MSSTCATAPVTSWSRDAAASLLLIWTPQPIAASLSLPLLASLCRPARVIDTLAARLSCPKYRVSPSARRRLACRRPAGRSLRPPGRIGTRYPAAGLARADSGTSRVSPAPAAPARREEPRLQAVTPLPAQVAVRARTDPPRLPVAGRPQPPAGWPPVEFVLARAGKLPVQLEQQDGQDTLAAYLNTQLVSYPSASSASNPAFRPDHSFTELAPRWPESGTLRYARQSRRRICPAL
jgi:hypothetical protein